MHGASDSRTHGGAVKQTRRRTRSTHHYSRDITGMTDNGANDEAPPLHGDGVTDDTNAYQWYLDHDRAPPTPPTGGIFLIRLDALRGLTGVFLS